MYNKKILVLLTCLLAPSFSLVAMEVSEVDQKQQTNQSLALKSEITCNDQSQSALLQNQLQFAQLRTSESFNVNVLQINYKNFELFRKRIGGDDILDQDKYYDSNKEKTFGEIDKKKQENRKLFFETARDILKDLLDNDQYSTKEKKIERFEEDYNKKLLDGKYTPSQFFNNFIAEKLSISSISSRSIGYLSKNLLNTADSNYKIEGSYGTSAVNILQRNLAGENIAFLNPDSEDSKKIIKGNLERFEKFNNHVEKFSSVIMSLQEALKSYYENDKIIQQQEEEMVKGYLLSLITLQKISSDQIECYKKIEEINTEAKSNNDQLQQKIKDGQVEYKSKNTKDLLSLSNE